MLAQPGGKDAFGFNRLVLINRTTGKAASYDVGPTEILEEHFIVPKPQSDTDFWILGTSLGWQKGLTNLAIYEG